MPAPDARQRVAPAPAATPRAGLARPRAARERAHHRESVRRRALAVGDVLAVLCSVAVFSVLHADALSGPGVATVAAVAVGTTVLFAKVMRLYDGDAQRIFPRTLDEVPRLVVAVGGGALLSTFVAASFADAEVTRWDAPLVWFVGVVLVTTDRVVGRAAVRRRTPPERLVVLGRGPLADVLQESCAKRPHDADLRTLGLPEPDDTPHWAAEVVSRCVEDRIDRVVVVSDHYDGDTVLELTRGLRERAISLSLVPSILGEAGVRLTVEHVDGVGVLGVPAMGRTRSTMVLKRAFDLALAVPLTLLAAPAIVVGALLVRATSSGPAFYRQERIGRGGQPFTMIKFRTMVDGAHDLRAELADHNSHRDPRLFKLDDDPRVTRFGGWLRRTSLDELPQLFNVLQGSMSIVGPRPLLPEEDHHVVGWHRRRLDLAPGLTGPWQVLQEHRVPFDAMVKIDTLYVLEWSPWTDLKIILRTLPVVVGRRSR